MASYPTSKATDAELHVSVNNLQTTLNGAIDNATTTVVLVDASNFPTAGFVTIDGEIIQYTGKSVNTLTGVTRGADGTAAASHLDGATVEHFIIAAHHNDIKDEIIAIEDDLIDIKAALNDADTPASTAANVTDRLDQIVSKLKLITGETNWFDANANDLQDVAAKVDKSGDTMAGDLAMGANKVTGLGASTVNGDAIRHEQLFGTGGVELNGNLSFADTTEGIVGTNTNDNAPSGNVGEFIQSTASGSALPATTIFGSLTSISLPAGDWDVTGIVYWNVASGNWTKVDMGVSTTAGNSTTGLNLGDNRLSLVWNTANDIHEAGLTVASFRISLASTTTVFLKYSATYVSGAPTASGRLSARRVR